MTIKHLHHIIPKHMGGNDDPSNLVQLTVEEHAEAHKKLFEEHGRWQDELAWKMLSGQITSEEARIESVRRSLTGKPKSEKHKAKMREAWKTRPPMSKETREKLRLAKIGKKYPNRKRVPCSDKTKEALAHSSRTRIRSPHSEETKAKISMSMRKRLADGINNGGERR